MSRPLTGSSAGTRNGSPVKRRGTTGKRFCATPLAIASATSTAAPDKDRPAKLRGEVVSQAAAAGERPRCGLVQLTDDDLGERVG